jgi:NADH-quinone oxidoreductase subunit L
MFSLGLNLFLQGFFHLITHAVSKALLFISVGLQMMTKSHHQDFRFLNSSGLKTVLINICSVYSIFSLSGIVFFKGFYSKEGVLETPLVLSRKVVNGRISLILLFSFYYRFRMLTMLFSPLRPSVSFAPSYSQSFLALLPLLLCRVLLGGTLNQCFSRV